MKGNTFDGNGNGLELIYTDLNASGEFEVSGNAIINSGGYGVRIEQYAQPTITGNDLDGSGGYAIDNQTSKGINAKNNWWGAAITLEMTTGANPKNLIKVYDSYDDSNMGFVNYGGWLDGTALDPDNPPSAIQMERGTVTLTKSDGEVTTTYEAGDKVYISLKDSDRNGDAGAVEEAKVLITTETENTGTKASAGAVTAGSGNQGDGTLTVSKTGYDTKTEDWTLTCVSVDGNPSFKVVGSVSGEQQSQYGIGSSSYTSDNAEVSLSITQGSTGFGILDTFKFSTTAGDVSGEEITPHGDGSGHRDLQCGGGDGCHWGCGQ